LRKIATPAKAGNSESNLFSPGRWPGFLPELVCLCSIQTHHHHFLRPLANVILYHKRPKKTTSC